MEHNYENCHNITCRRRCANNGYNLAIDDVIRVVNGILPLDLSCGSFIDRDLLKKKLKELRM